MFSDLEISQIKEKLSAKPNVVIITHFNPDGDAIGSSLGLKFYLKEKGVESEVITPNDFPKFLKWLPDSKKITIAEYKKKKAVELIENADLIFILDFNTPSRAGQLIADLIQKSTATKILIDHHQQPDDFDFVYSDTQIPATCQMVYHFMEKMQDTSLLNQNIAECLYTGMMTDTGGFRFRSTSATTHRIIANLIEKGAEPAMISSQVMDNNTLCKLQLLSLILGRIELLEEGKISILYLRREELKKYGFEKGDTDGFVNYGLSIAGVGVSVFFMEDLYEDYIKISFRSKGEIDVNQFSRKFFQGGGHLNAAGGKSYENLEETILNFKKLASNLF